MGRAERCGPCALTSAETVNGDWFRKHPSALGFGPLATTDAFCQSTLAFDPRHYPFGHSLRSKKHVDGAAVATPLAYRNAKSNEPFDFRQGGNDRSTTTVVAQPTKRCWPIRLRSRRHSPPH